MRFSHNDREFAQLNRMLGSCLSRKGGVVLVDGTVASGKTELIKSFSDKAVGGGVLVLSALAVQTENEIPLGVVDQLAHNASAQVPGIAELQEAIEAAACLTTAGATDPERVSPEHGRVLAQLHAAMMRLAAQRPLVITVDDLHHADQISLQFLCYLARRILNKRVMVVLGLQPGPLPAFPLFQMEMSSQTNCRRIVLEPLSVRHVGRILSEATGGQADAARLAPLYRSLSGGNPLLVNALVADRLEGHDGTGVDAGLPHYRRAVLTCLQRMDGVSTQVAQGHAVLEATGSRHLIGRLLQLDNTLVRRSEHILFRSGLLTAQGFRHPEARAAALESLHPERRAELHTGAARLLFQEGARAADVGTQLLAADSAKDPWAVPLLIDAAEQQLQADRLDQATTYVRLAQREAVTEQQHADVTLMLARTEWRLNPAVVARHLGLGPGATCEAPLQTGQAVQMIRGLLEQGLLEQATEALRWAGESGFDIQHADCEEWNTFKTWLACTYPPLALELPGVPERTEPPGRACHPRPGGELGDSARLLGSVLRGDLADSGLKLAEDRLRMMRLGAGTVEALGNTLRALVYADRYGSAQDWGELLLKEANDRHDPEWVASFASVMAEVAIGRGEPEAAADYARTALTCGAHQTSTVLAGIARAMLMLALVETGDLDGVQRLLSQENFDAAAHSRESLYLLQARGHYHLARRQPHLALRDFSTCGQRMTAWKVDSPSFIPWRTDRAQALIDLDRHEDARGAAEEQLALLVPAQRRTRAITLRVLAQTVEPAQRSPLLEEALQLMTETPDHSERTRILRLLGCNRRPPAAPEHLHGAAVTPPSEDVRGIADLSAAEQRVALLVGKGYTNSEAASELFITVSTVEQHLTRIYRKLGIKQRSDLRAWLVDCHA
ncbi:LuxR family transcriptional regulator [Streptomyces sp. CC219B]|uniref:helix-turn-helix transcriptional regulator n=1 Tax=Streptomyces sp. CC219B TaxID=3044574 RepID=UPI0024A964E6|nr:LuxR family transcriptional regulator [Streptomyces sp. CC219B]